MNQAPGDAGPCAAQGMNGIRTPCFGHCELWATGETATPTVGARRLQLRPAVTLPRGLGSTTGPVPPRFNYDEFGAPASLGLSLRVTIDHASDGVIIVALVNDNIDRT